MYARPEPTEAAIQTAEKNVAPMWKQGYTMKQSQSVPEAFFVNSPKGKTYIVSTNKFAPSCDCPQWETVGVCKHQVFVGINLQEAESAEDAEMGRYGQYA